MWKPIRRTAVILSEKDDQSGPLCVRPICQHKPLFPLILVAEARRVQDLVLTETMRVEEGIMIVTTPRPPRTANRPPNSGFTMIEIVVVLAIVVLLSLFTVGAYLRMQQAQKISVLADRVVGNLQSARSLAINNSRSFYLVCEQFKTNVGLYQLTVVEEKDYDPDTETMAPNAVRREAYPIEKRFRITKQSSLTPPIVPGDDRFAVKFEPDGTAEETTVILIWDSTGGKTRFAEVFKGGMIRRATALDKSLGNY
jgi:prepilin-type N-terminal cleavage/methylation domain-containing protein